MNATVTATTMISFLLKIRVTSISFFDPDFMHQDLVIQLYADVLCVLIVVLSSAQDMNVSLHFPSKKQLSVSPIIVAHQAEGGGHFDGTLEEDFDDCARPGMCN